MKSGNIPGGGGVMIGHSRLKTEKCVFPDFRFRVKIDLIIKSWLNNINKLNQLYIQRE